jgi:hypothetical protein
MCVNLLVAFFTTPWKKGQTQRLENNKKQCQIAIFERLDVD